MLTLVNTLIVFFILLILYQIVLANRSREGIENNQEYKDYDMNNPANALILAQQNAGNIEVLRGRVDQLDGVKDRVDTLQKNVDSMQTQIEGLVQQQADYATDLAGDTPAEVTGLDEEDVEDVEDEYKDEDEE